MNIAENLSVRIKPLNVREDDAIPVTLYSYATVTPASDAIRVELRSEDVSVADGTSITELLDDADSLAAGGPNAPSSVTINVPVTLNDSDAAGSAVFALYYEDEPVDETVVKVLPEE